MKVKCYIKGVRSDVELRPMRHVKKPFLILISFMIVNSVSYNANAIETTRAAGSTNGLHALNTNPSSNQDDRCLSLLKTVRYNTASDTGSSSIRRPAGKHAATVGFVLGLRIALGPTETTGPNRTDVGIKNTHGANQNNNGYALAIADYRHCKNTQALKQLNKERRLDR